MIALLSGVAHFVILYISCHFNPIQYKSPTGCPLKNKDFKHYLNYPNPFSSITWNVMCGMCWGRRVECLSYIFTAWKIYISFSFCAKEKIDRY